MDFNATKVGLNNGRAAGAKTLLHSSPKPSTISPHEIRELRSSFEQDVKPMNLGSDQQQSLMIAMYEATEHLVGKPVSSFELMTYMESLKSTAQELSSQGLTQNEFKNSIMRHSQNEVYRLIRST